MEEVLIPMTVFGCIAACIWIVYHYNTAAKERVQDTICKAIDAGQQLSPETIKALGIKSASSPTADRRKAVILIALGIATIIFGQAIPDNEAPQIMMGISAFPIVLGIGYFLVYRLGRKEPQ